MDEKTKRRMRAERERIWPSDVKSGDYIQVLSGPDEAPQEKEPALKTVMRELRRRGKQK